MKAADWEAPDQRAFMLALRERAGTDLLLAFNGGAAPVDLTLPKGNWRLALSSAEQGAVLPAHGRCRLSAVTLAVLEPATSSEEIPS
jgi:pullulanase/glycogen debranching enzyme